MAVFTILSTRRFAQWWKLAATWFSGKFKEVTDAVESINANITNGTNKKIDNGFSDMARRIGEWGDSYDDYNLFGVVGKFGDVYDDHTLHGVVGKFGDVAAEETLFGAVDYARSEATASKEAAQAAKEAAENIVIPEDVARKTDLNDLIVSINANINNAVTSLCYKGTGTININGEEKKTYVWDDGTDLPQPYHTLQDETKVGYSVYQSSRGGIAFSIGDITYLTKEATFQLSKSGFDIPEDVAKKGEYDAILARIESKVSLTAQDAIDDWNNA